MNFPCCPQTAACGWLGFASHLQLASALLLILSSIASRADPPNVLLILTDDQGYGDLSCHGNPVLKTPNLDRLHDESIRFTDFHVAPMCTPTRGQLMTGVDALRNGAMNVSSGRTPLRQDFSTMPEIFAANGYRTAIFGKWHLGDNYPYRPQDRGFHECVWFPASHISSAPDYWNNDYFDDTYYHQDKRQAYQGYCTDVFFREAMAWMAERAKKKERFFCYLPVNAPHAPLFVPARYRAPYTNQEPAIARFFGMIACIDENIGRLRDFLSESGLDENTVLIFMTDNGTATGNTVFNAGMRGRKTDLYEGGHRVPLFVHWPAGRLRQPGNVTALVECQDVLPTLIELCALKPPAKANFDGTSLARWLHGQTAAPPDRMLVSQFSRINRPWPAKGDAVVMWNRWRLVQQKELYNLEDDPSQQHNVFGDHPDVVRQMSQHYDRWWAKIEPNVNEFSPIHIGHVPAGTVMLTPCDWRDVFLDQQAQIRRTQTNGAWTLFVEHDGHYDFSLRRWPSESKLAITAAAPRYRGEDGVYAAGKALPIASARIQVGSADLVAPVQSEDEEVVFHLALKRGPATLKTAFCDDHGIAICGAYYVYVATRP